MAQNVGKIALWQISLTNLATRPYHRACRPWSGDKPAIGAKPNAGASTIVVKTAAGCVSTTTPKALMLAIAASISTRS
jgi:hypothetical protein